jgi:hypothetical protein
MKPTHTIILVLGVILIIMGGDIAGHYANRYSLVDGGRHRIDHINGEVWERKTKEVFDIEVARRTLKKIRARDPRFEDADDDSVIAFIHGRYLEADGRDQPKYACMRTVSYWERVNETEEQAMLESDEIPSMIAASVEVDE